ADHHQFQLRVLAMESLQGRGEGVARAALWAGENQQHPTPAQVTQRQLAAPVQPWQAEVGRGRAGFQAVALDFAARQRAIAEASDTTISVSVFLLPVG